jgi:uncharacterized membrane protein YoaK (UPF0700 family)
MPMSAQPSNPDRLPSSSSREVLDATELHELLPAMLSGVAGMVDVIGFLSLGLFTAHVTGNLVVIAALLVRGGPPNIAQILAVPVFMAVVAAVWLIAKASNRRGPALAKLLLAVQLLLLSCVLIFSIVFDPAIHLHGFLATIAAMIAVSAMACQFALLRLAMPGAPSTAVMTGNLTSGVLSLLDTLSPGQPIIDGSRERLRKTAGALVGFCSGCVVGAAAVSWLGAWAWSLPVALAGLAMALQ